MQWIEERTLEATGVHIQLLEATCSGKRWQLALEFWVLEALSFSQAVSHGRALNFQ
jgi:hypothetical protein